MTADETPLTGVPAPIFVVGCPRSGNTLCGAILNKHPDLFITFETQLFWELYRLWLYRLRAEVAGGREQFVSLVEAKLARYNQPFEITRRDVEEAIADQEPRWAPMLDAYMRLMMRRAKPEAKRWGDKSPNNSGVILHIQREFPGAQTVYVHRNPLSVVISVSRPTFPHATSDDFKNAVAAKEYWVEYANQQPQIDHSRHLEVRYEDLVDDPETIVRRICGFLQVSYHDQLLEQADQRVQDMIGWQGMKYWAKITPQSSQKTDALGPYVKAYLAPWTSRLGYAKSQPPMAFLYRGLAALRVAPFAATSKLVSFFFSLKYPGFPLIIFKYPSISVLLRWARLKRQPGRELMGRSGARRRRAISARVGAESQDRHSRRRGRPGC